MNASAPHTIGRYEIVETLATGGMATVYLARITGPGGFAKLFALKTIHPHLIAQEGFVEMFLDEARIVSRIDHPNVCQVVDFGVGTGSYFIAMELLLGENLAKLQPHFDHVRGGDRHVEMVCRILAAAAEGVHAAHEVRDDQGVLLQVVHRDISRSNLFVTFDGVVKVVDFGIASAADQLHLTRTGTLKGKFAYMAPEQLEQQPVDRRADIWALGVVLWELLTGERLFARKRQVDSMRAVLEGPIPAPSSCNDAVSPALDLILMRALARVPAQRFATARELAQALERHAEAQGWTLTPRELGERVRTLCGESFRQQSAMVARARSGSAQQVSVPSVRDEHPVEETRTRPSGKASRALPAAPSPNGGSSAGKETEEARSSTSDKERPSRLGGSRWTVLIALLALMGTAVAAYVAGSRTSQEPAGGPTEANAPEVVADAPVTPVAPAAFEANPSAPIPVSPPESTVDGVRDGAEEMAGGEEELPVMDAVPSMRRPPGFVNITTPGGWAEVWVGGRRIGRTPLRARLPAGRRRVLLKPFGQGRVRRTVVVRPREATRLVVPVEAP